MRIVFLAVVLGLLALIHWYLWKRLVRDVSRPGSVFRRAGTLLILLFPLLMLTFFAGRALGLPFAVEQVIAWPGAYWFVVMLYLGLALLAGEIVRPLLLRALERRALDDAGRLSRPGLTGTEAEAEAPAVSTEEKTGTGDEAQDGPASPERRLFVARAIAIGAGAVAAGTVGYGSHAARQLTTKHVPVQLAGLPRAAHGYRIAVVSDIHLSSLLGASHCRRVVDVVNRTGADLVAVVGDLVDAGVEDLRSAAAPLAELSSRDGTFFVTGNHEYYVGAEQWLDHLRNLGMVVLENERREMPYFDLAGVNDVAGEDSGQGPDFTAALGDRDRRRTSVLLAHQPVLIHDAVEHGVDLQLSGHTHGGQLWPGNALAALANPTLEGLERYGDTQLYVTRGAGTWGPPVRVGAEPDITVVELSSPQA